MKITLITVCFNSEKTIKDTLKSVLKQTYKDYEYLIIDGKSNDGTIDIIKEYEPKFNGRLKWISEKDNGLYDAMNKGIKLAKGEVIGILNSDDIFANNNVLKTISDTFKKKKCDASYSDLVFMDEETMKVPQRYFISKTGNYKLGWHPPHPTLYVKKNIYDKYGLYNQDYRIAADYDFMLRIMKNKVKIAYIPKVLIHMRSGGVSTNGIKGYIKSFKESLAVLKNNEIKCAFFVNSIRTVKVVLQGVKAKIKRLV